MKQKCNTYTTTGGCGCEQESCDCGCKPGGQVEPAEIQCGCGCAPGLVAALQLLCEPRLAPLVDFSQFAFFTKNFVLGTSLDCPDAGAAVFDNLTGPLDGEFVSINPNSCDRLEVSGQIYYPSPVCDADGCCSAGPGFTARSIDICSICAVSFAASTTPYPVPPFPQPPAVPVENDPAAPDEPAAAPAADLSARAYRQARAQLWQRLHPGRAPFGPTLKPTPCDGSNAGCDGLDCRRSLSLTAGPLLVSNAAVLGSVGDVLVLGNDVDYRFYFVCKSCLGFID